MAHEMIIAVAISHTPCWQLAPLFFCWLDADKEMAAALSTERGVNAFYAIFDQHLGLIFHILCDFLRHHLALDGEVEWYDSERSASAYHSAADKLSFPGF